MTSYRQLTLSICKFDWLPWESILKFNLFDEVPLAKLEAFKDKCSIKVEMGDFFVFFP